MSTSSNFYRKRHQFPPGLLLEDQFFQIDMPNPFIIFRMPTHDPPPGFALNLQRKQFPIETPFRNLLLEKLDDSTHHRLNLFPPFRDMVSHRHLERNVMTVVQRNDHIEIFIFDLVRSSIARHDKLLKLSYPQPFRTNLSHFCQLL